MKKSDLIPGEHAIVMRDGWVGLVLKGYLMGMHGYYSLRYYTEDLLDADGTVEHDAMKILEVPNTTIFSRLSECKVIWERGPDIKEVTMAEIEEKFGCKVKIIKE